MDLQKSTIVLAGSALLAGVALVIFGSLQGDSDVTAGALDLLQVVVGGIAGALGASLKKST